MRVPANRRARAVPADARCAYSPVDGGRGDPSTSNEFSGDCAEIDEMARPTRTFAPIYTVGRKERGSGVGEGGVPLLLERLDALAQVVRVEQHMLAGGLAGQRGVEVGQRGAVDGLLGLGVGDRGSGQQSRSPCRPRPRVPRPDSTALTRPAASASAAGNRSASSAIFIARVRPIDAATNADAPPSGISPILVNANRKYAFSEAITRSHARASDTPTPAAGPCTTATTGRGRFTIARTARLACDQTSPPARGRRRFA